MNSTLKNLKNKHLTSSECHKLEILLKSKMKVKGACEKKSVNSGNLSFL